MGFRFRRSVKLMPGVRMNFSTRGASMSLGGRGATLNVSSRGTRTTVGIPGTGLSYSAASSSRSGYRRPSAQQIAAAHRRMAQEQRRETAQRDVDRLEAELQETLDAWRDLPTIPSAEEFAKALAVRPFTESEPVPPGPQERTCKGSFHSQLTDRARVERPQGWSRFAWIPPVVIPPLTLGQSQLGPAIGLAIFLGLLTWVIARLTWYARILVLVRRRFAGAWPSEWQRLQAEHRSAVEAHGARMAVEREGWLVSEQERVADGRRVLGGDLAAIERSVSAAVGALDFPFEAECAVGIDEEDHAMIDVDLPEIEDAVPETRFTVARDGSLKETKRKAAERNEAYATLVTGIAFTVAATAFAAAPTLRIVTVAGHTQRKTRGALDAVDAYVYEVRFPREVFVQFDPGTLDPVTAVQRLPSRIEQTASGVLKKLPEPKWADALWAE